MPIFPILTRAHTKIPRFYEGFSCGAVVDEARTVFKRINDAMVCISDLHDVTF